tara:strand:+ start:176 stop:484 length:309 start_codon:yes stop_codon:yes gene_type:complete
MGRGRPPKVVVEESSTNWKRTRAKKTLIEIFPFITSEQMIFHYKEIEDKIYIRYTFEWCSIDKKDFKKYLDPLTKNGKVEEVKPELSEYIDEVFKKWKNKQK